MSAQIEDIEFRSGDALCKAWFFVPDGEPRVRPCIVLGHGLGLTRRSGLHEFGQAFAAAGYCALVFDYRSFGDSEGSPRQIISFGRQLADWQAAIDYARTRSEIDPDQVITWGFSLGAGHAVSAASRDRRVAAVVSVAPMLSGLSSTLAAMKWWSLPVLLKIAANGLLDIVRRIFGTGTAVVPLAAPKGQLGLLTSPDAHPGYEAVVPTDFEYGTAAAIGLYFWTYRPGRLLRGLKRPVLLMPSKIDRVTPPGPTARFAKRCPNAQVVELSCHHMEAAVEPNRSIVTAATIQFLKQALEQR